MSNVFDQACDAQALLHRPLDPSAFPETQAFEAALSQCFGVREAVAVSSGTAALHCALAAAGIGPGDEVLVPSLAVIMSIAPVLYAGATPVFVDTAPGRVDFDYDDLERKVTSRSKAIIPVYLWGAAYTMPRLLEVVQRHHLVLIEDACQAHGSQWEGRYLGTWGDAGCFSMRDGKILSTGEGGFVLTNRPELAAFCRAFRNHWANPLDPSNSYRSVGYNYRLSEVQAWLGRKHLEHFEQLRAQRAWAAQYLLAGLAETAGIKPYRPASQEQFNWFSPVLLLDEMLIGKGIARRLAERGVINSVGTFGLRPAQEWPLFASHLSQPIVTPHAQQFLERTLAITLFSHYTAEDLERRIALIKTTLAEEF